MNFKSTDEQLEYADIITSAGLWEDVKNEQGKIKAKLINPYIIRIHTDGWKNRKAYVLNSINVCREEIIKISQKDYEKNKNKDKENKDKKKITVKGWLFFMGKQDEENKFLFHVNDHRLICCEPGKLIFPNYLSK